MHVEFSPSVYEHAAKVIGKSPWEVSRDVELLSKAHIEAFRLYRHRPVVVGIDIYNLEAEAYGAFVGRAAGNAIPAIQEYPCPSARELLSLKPFDPKTAGRIPMVIEAAKCVHDNCPDADVRIPLSGPFSLAANLVGFENLLCEIQTAPDLVAGALRHLAAGQVKFCKEIARNDLDIAFFESGAVPPLLSPQQFRRIELESLKAIMQKTAAVVGHPVPCIMGGDTLPILDDILSTGTGYVCCPAKTNQRKFMEKMRDHLEVMVRINMDARAITSKNIDEIEKEVDRILALVDNRPNASPEHGRRVCIGTGCLPYEAEPEVVLKTKQYILSKNV
jgi:uroporphyrinogen decarboxylase